MNRFEQDRLAEEILRTDDLADLRRDSLAQGIGVLRRRQQCRRAFRLSALAAAPGILLLAAFVWARTNFWSRPASDSPSIAGAAPTAPANVETIKFINDDELLALFPNRPVALIGKPGEQQFVFLDELAAVHRTQVQ